MPSRTCRPGLARSPREGNVVWTGGGEGSERPDWRNPKSLGGEGPVRALWGPGGRLENACALPPSPRSRALDMAMAGTSRAFCSRKPPDKRLGALRARGEALLFGWLSALAPLASPIAAAIGRAGPELRSGAPGRPWRRPERTVLSGVGGGGRWGTGVGRKGRKRAGEGAGGGGQLG